MFIEPRAEMARRGIDRRRKTRVAGTTNISLPTRITRPRKAGLGEERAAVTRYSYLRRWVFLSAILRNIVCLRPSDIGILLALLAILLEHFTLPARIVLPARGLLAELRTSLVPRLLEALRRLWT